LQEAQLLLRQLALLVIGNSYVLYRHTAAQCAGTQALPMTSK